MKKIIAYGVRKDEMPYFKKWAEDNSDVQVKTEPKLLDDSTVSEAKGFDGVDAYQQKPYTASVLNKLGSYGIHALSLRNVGVDNVDAKALKANNMKLTNVPSYSPEAIAELAVTDMLRLVRRGKIFDKKIMHGDLRWAPDVADEMDKMTVGIFGTGHIGRMVIKILRGFGSKIIAYDPYPNPKLEKEGIYVKNPKELYAKSDIITIHAPALKSNYHMINAKAFSEMKDGVYLINAARGTLVDTDALIKALDSGKVQGAGLDTYENEVGNFNKNWGSLDAIPDARLKNLIKRDNVIVTPHIAFYTKIAVKNMVEFSMSANKDLLETGKSDKLVKF
ncbi:D-2-hydroxyacid dehydrogenase [Acetilactobacillus jinshanensis]|uniref:D-2-hydroxyacid dehydrogenase n=1 Tax=Acetilactobacillus jinshanensis TaxID=1720083 RepID=A0A4P6ZJX8_9LACO|nr:D-2-hydroxyacid dehydrogenase [Acetilactobacillus jinshanensis]QBP17944.1 D-2-hydroxyacid dehydrogenase [Acetilactobacillus jinshanensis]URL60807.1 D-2-hydroxyacid dehydrogenase [uncultured bacterium]